jgi:hypothetical protein
MDYPETIGTFQQTLRGVPVKVDYRYFSPEEGGPDVQVRAVYLPGYPEIDVKECLDYDTLSCFESNAMWHENVVNTKLLCNRSPQGNETRKIRSFTGIRTGDHGTV